MIISAEQLQGLLAAVRDQKIEVAQAMGARPVTVPFVPGEEIRAEIMARLPSGDSLVALKGRLLNMELPPGIKPGEVLRLVFLNSEPRPTFALSQSARQGTPVTLSDTARWLGQITRETAQTAAPLKSPAPPPTGPPQNTIRTVGDPTETIANSESRTAAVNPQGTRKETPEAGTGSTRLPGQSTTETAQTAAPLKSPAPGITQQPQNMPHAAGGLTETVAKAESPTAPVTPQGTRQETPEAGKGTTRLPGQITSEPAQTAAPLKNPASILNEPPQNRAVTPENLNDAVVKNNPRPAFPPPEGMRQGIPATAADMPRLHGQIPSETAQTAAPLKSTAPLLHEPPLNPAHTAERLKETLTKSGLFYESHLASWSKGRYPLPLLRLEPQAALSLQPQNPASEKTATENEPATPSASHPTTAPRELADPRSIPLIREQLEFLQNRTFVWQGEGWPGQKMEWTVSDREAESRNQADRSWKSSIRLLLPNLGEVNVSIDLKGKTVAFKIQSASESIGNRLSDAREELISSLENHNMRVANVEIRHAG